MELFLIFLLLALVCAVYFLPTIIASSRKHHNAGSVFIINLFLGWTFLGWVIALAMAMSAVRDAGPKPN